MIVYEGQSTEQVEGKALYFSTTGKQAVDVKEALAAYKNAKFSTSFRPQRSEVKEIRDLWIALPIKAASANQGSIRRSIGLGGIFYVVPEIYIARQASDTEKILGGLASARGELLPRKLTYLHSASFELDPGQSELVLINLAGVDRPSIGLFREGELGRNQIIGTLLKAGIIITFLAVGICLIILGILARRWVTILIAVGFSLVAIQSDVSLFTTILASDFDQARLVWRSCITFVSCSLTAIILMAFWEKIAAVSNRIGQTLLVLLPFAGIGLLFWHKLDSELVAIFYSLVLGLIAVIAFRLETTKRLRWIAVAAIMLCSVAIILVEPALVGTVVPELFSNFVRDMMRLVVAATLLVIVIVDIQRNLKERDRLTNERIDALKAQSASDRRLLVTERRYARARDKAQMRKQQLASASHDIRQPLMGLRAAIREEADKLSQGLQGRLGEAIDYLEELTHEYSDRDRPAMALHEIEEDAYSLELIVETVDDMFSGEAAKLGISLETHRAPCRTQLPALALIRATSNLVANALRHADAKHVTLAVLHEDHCIIEVSDDGCGMDAEQLEKAQQRGAKNEDSQGDGLGLAIVHELATRHGFEISITSKIGHGTTARIILTGA
ncbi:MAG: HAMP domain-containing sensor histidine kinase [Parasphingorhabdus sp.]|uniref:sensor histidine kinase n=1 Tax=Parasphingorhabdus sp. TaxID=2709688 RepID=UPI00329764DB